MNRVYLDVNMLASGFFSNGSNIVLCMLELYLLASFLLVYPLFKVISTIIISFSAAVLYIYYFLLHSYGITSTVILLQRTLLHLCSFSCLQVMY